MPEVVLIIGGERFEGWQAVNVTTSLEALAGQFELGVAENGPANSPARRIRPGDACTLQADGATLITGFVDEVLISIEAGSHEIKVIGRDATGDLVDCSAINEPGAFKGQTLLAIVKAIVAPFKIPVIDRARAAKPFPQFKIQQGETCFEAIARACRARGVRPYSDGLGSLVLAPETTARAGVRLVEGANILAGRARHSLAQRHDRIIVKGQDLGFNWSGATGAARQKGEVRDAGVGRYRPLLLLAETAGDGIDFEKRALHELKLRLGGDDALITLEGWREQGDSGDLWRIDRLVGVEAPSLALELDLVIRACRYQLNGDDGGTVELGLARPAALNLLPIEEADTGAQWGAQ